MICHAQANGHAMPMLSVVIQKKTVQPIDLMDYRRMAIEVPFLEAMRWPIVLCVGWLMAVRLVIQFLVLNGPIDLTVLGIS